jgi:hypothetical protein
MNAIALNAAVKNIRLRRRTGTSRAWANDPVLTVMAETPRNNAATRMPRGSMRSLPCASPPGSINAQAQKSFG